MSATDDPALATRQQIWRETPQRLLKPEHTAHCRLLPSREDMLDLMPKGGVIAEVGVSKGDFSREIWNRTAPKCLHLVDAWSLDRFSPGLDVVKAIFSSQIQDGSVQLNVGYSVPILQKFADSYFDFVYIDTDHSYKTTFAELMIAARKVKTMGFIAGHDFCTGNIVGAVVYGVIQACCQFCDEQGWGLRYLTMEPHGHWSFCLQRIDRRAD